MPVLENRHALPRSALHHRPISSDQASGPGLRATRKPRAHADALTTASYVVPDDLDLEEEHLPYRRRSASSVPRARAIPPGHLKRRFHPLALVGLAMLVMIFGWVALSALGIWWQTTQNDWHYGRPRTFQTDAVVGHRDSPQNPSHFIAMNLNRHILIIEIPGGDASKMVAYSGPILLGPGQDLTPVTLTFQDINHDGKIDMVVHVAGSQLVFFNANGIFVAPAQNQNGSG